MKSQKNIKYDLKIKPHKNKFRIAAETIYTALGENNYKNPYNCMTRFRAKIENKDLVDVELIKTLEVVKGVNFNGPEIQIIIGGEVPRVIDEFKKYEIEDKTEPLDSTQEAAPIKRIAMSKRFMAAVIGIIQPAIGTIILGGMLVALYSLLTIEGGPLGNRIIDPSGALDSEGNPIMIGISMQTLYLFNIWDALFFVLANMIMPSIGIYFIYNTARYFDANPWFAITVGLFLLAQGFFPLVLSQYGVATNVNEATFGRWISDGSSGKSGFFLFNIGTFPIVVMGYQGSIIPYVIGGLLVVYLDKWIKTWMPPAIDITFRGLLVILFSMFILWFALAPLSSLIEYGLFELLTVIGKIPYGFGTGIFAALWQPLVIIGAHTPLGVAIDVSISNGTPQLLATANVTPYWGQLGAVIAVGIISKNMTLKKIAFSTVPAGIFGITEPIIYGVNLPRVKPFIYGCLAAVGGLLIGILDLDIDTLGTFGILSILRFNDAAITIDQNFAHNIYYSQGVEVALVLMTWAITFAVGFALTLFLYKERKNELSYFKKAINKIIKWTSGEKQTVLKSFDKELISLKEKENLYKDVEKYYSKLSKLESKLEYIEQKEDKARGKMYSKLKRMKNSLLRKDNPELFDKFEVLNNKYSTFAFDAEKQKYQKEITSIKTSNATKLEQFDTFKEKFYKESFVLVKKFDLSEAKKEVANNIVWNALNGIEVSFGMIDPKSTDIKKGE